MLLIYNYIKDLILFLVDKIVDSLADFQLLFDSIKNMFSVLFTGIGNIVSIGWFWIPISILIALIIFFRVYALIPTIIGGGGNGQ